MEGESTDRRVPRSVLLAFKVLEAVADDQPIGVGALSRRLDLPKSTVQRALRGLEHAGYVYQSDDLARWSLTMRAFRLGSRVQELDVRKVALPEMERLLAETLDAVQLGILDGHEVVIVEKVDSPRPIRAYSERGSTLPAWSTASGRVLITDFSDSDLEDLLRRSLEGRYPPGLDDADVLRRELDRVRQQGWAGNDGELSDDVAAVAAAVRDASGTAVASLCVTAPTARLRRGDHAELAKKVVAAADRISRRLGWGQPFSV